MRWLFNVEINCLLLTFTGLSLFFILMSTLEYISQINSIKKIEEFTFSLNSQSCIQRHSIISSETNLKYSACTGEI